MFLRNGVEGKDIIVVPERLLRRSRKEYVFVPRSTATKKGSTSKPGKEEKEKEEDHAKGEENLNDKQADMLPSAAKKQAPFDENRR